MLPLETKNGCMLHAGLFILNNNGVYLLHCLKTKQEKILSIKI